MPHIIFLVRDVCQSLHTTTRWGEIFVDHNLLCYFREQSAADGFSPTPLLDDGKYILSGLIEEAIVTFTLTNISTSNEIILDVVPSGNGLWLSDNPQGTESAHDAKLAEQLAIALKFSDGENEIDASVISWTLGNVIHMDVQAAAVPHSGGSDRISPDFTLSNQWDFDGLKFGDSGTLAFNLLDNVLSLRIEYLLTSTSADSSKINFKLNELDTIVGIAPDSAVGVQQRICVLITNPQQLAESLRPGRNLLKQTIAADGATIAIERIRLSYYRPDPIVTWEIDNQLTRLRLRTNLSVIPGQAPHARLSGSSPKIHPIRWELLSGKPPDGINLNVSEQDSLRATNGFSLETLGQSSRYDTEKVYVIPRPMLAIDHGIGNGREGIISNGFPGGLHIAWSTTPQDPIVSTLNFSVLPYGRSGVTEHSSDKGLLLPQRVQPDEDASRREEVRKFTDELSAGDSRPAGVTEADAIGFSTLPGVYPATGDFLSLKPISGLRYLQDIEDSDIPIRFANHSCRRMLPDVYKRLFFMLDFGDYTLKIIKAWVSPEGNDGSDWAHAQGRAVNFVAIDKVTGEAKPEFLSRLAAMASYLFDYVKHVAADPVKGEQAYIHVSRRFEVPKLEHLVRVISLDEYLKTADAHWEQLSDFDDTELLDQLITRFPQSSVCDAAISYRYDLLLKSVERLMSSDFTPDSHGEWKSESDAVIRACHRFILSFPGRLGSENVRTLLFAVLRRLEDAYADLLAAWRERLNNVELDPRATEQEKYDVRVQVNSLELNRCVAPDYQEFAIRYPATTEGRLAFARLYSLESERAKRADSTESYLSFMRDYPDAPQWDEIAKFARERSVSEERDILDRLKLLAETDDEFDEAVATRSDLEFLNQTQRLIDQLIDLFVDNDIDGTSRRETESAYSDPLLARYLVESLQRKKYVADKLEDFYGGLFGDLGDKIGLFTVQEKLVEIETQISELGELIKKNHSDITDLVISEERDTRNTISESFRAVAAGQDELRDEIEDGLSRVQDRFDRVDEQLKEIYDKAEDAWVNTEKVLARSDVILANQMEAKKQRDAMEIAIIEGIDLTQAVLEDVDEIKKRVQETKMRRGTIELRSSSGGSGSGRSWYGNVERWGKKVLKAVKSEGENLTAENIKQWVKDPAGTVRKRWIEGKNRLEVEINRGVRAAKSSRLYKMILSEGKNVLLEDPGTNMEEIKPKPGFDGSGLPFSRPSFDAERPVYFINGINNSRKEARKHAQYLADYQNVLVRLIYNHSSIAGASTKPPGVVVMYGDNDLTECIYDKLWPSAVIAAPIATFSLLLSRRRVQENPTSRHLAHQIFHETAKGNDVRVVAHSQGTLICRNALLACQILRGSTSKVSCVLAGAALTELEMIPPSQLANLTWIVNRRDPIAPLLGMKADIKGVTARDGLDRTEHNFSNDRGGNHGGETGSGKRTYVRMILPEYLKPSNQRGTTVFST